MNQNSTDDKSEKETPLAKLLANTLMGIEITTPQNDIPVEYFKVIFSKIYNYFYENGDGSQDEPVFKKITEVFGIKTEFEKNLKYPYSKKDKTGDGFRIIVLPDTGTETQREQQAFDMIKKFEGLEARGIYQLFLSMMNSYLYHPNNLIDFIKKCDPNPSREMEETYNNMFNWLILKGQQLNQVIESREKI